MMWVLFAFLGSLKMGFIGRFENLAEDRVKACEGAGIPVEPLPHINRNIVSVDYRTYYNDSDVNLVAAHWKEEIELFGYRFGS